jgi:hypothetical protein
MFLDKTNDGEQDEYSGFEEDLLKDKNEEENINNENPNEGELIENQLKK